MTDAFVIVGLTAKCGRGTLRAMKIRHWVRLIGGAGLAIGLVLAMISGCSQQPSPKEAVMDFFAALHTQDTTMVRQNVDYSRAWQSVQYELEERNDSARTNIDWASRLQIALSEDGFLRNRWTKMQIVIGETNVFGDSATVEVSFIDRVTRVQFYNEMALVLQDGQWRIVSFSI